MKKLKETESKWNPGQVKQFAEEILKVYANGSVVLFDRWFTEKAQEEAVFAYVAKVLVSQSTRSTFISTDVSALWRDIAQQLGIWKPGRRVNEEIGNNG